MARTLVHVPRMYTKEEFNRLVGMVPQDFDEREHEFWEYVEEKLKPLARRIRRVYLEQLSRGGEDGLKTLRQENSCHAIVRRLVANGAELHPTEDPLLVAETESWSEMLKNQPNPALLELYHESLRERDRHIVNVIDQTLKEGEIGVIFIKPAHSIRLPETIKLIKMCRFDPGDYVNLWLQKSKLQST